ncbi:MAG: alpha/beta hydrolase [Modestobacter sp.]|nr:alpha/beta hydrolase [Modestobacter sp.]
MSSAALRRPACDSEQPSPSAVAALSWDTTGRGNVETLKSSDGTVIAYQRTGTGPSLILVVGAFCDRSSTASLTPLLAPHFTVYEYDRRGRGSSGDSDEYSVDCEVDDLAALISAAGGSALVYGHSSGAALALEAAARGIPITGLAAYEPPYTAVEDGTGGSDELLEGVRARIGVGDPDGAAAVFMAGAGTPPEVIAMLQQGPAWPRMRELAPPLIYDLTLCNGGVVPGERLARIDVPTVTVSGGSSPEWAGRACATVAAAVPGARHVVLDGQTHAVAHDVVAPLLIDRFLRSPFQRASGAGEPGGPLDPTAQKSGTGAVAGGVPLRAGP